MLQHANSSVKGSAGVRGTSIEHSTATTAAGSKVVDEITNDFSKLLSEQNTKGHENLCLNTNNNLAESESEKVYHRCSLVRNHPENIGMNISNSVTTFTALPEKTAKQSKPLRMQFPVSSGQLHRNKESNWAPVSGNEPSHHFGFGHHHNSNNIGAAVVQTMPVQVTYPGQHMLAQPGLGSPMLPPQHHQSALPQCHPGQLIAYPTPLPPDQMYGSNTMQFSVPQGFEDRLPPCSGTSVDITNGITHRLSAMNGLHHNPNGIEAIMDAQSWMQPHYELGQFSGTTGARILSESELASGTQAWTRQDLFNAGAPVQSGMGMTMLQKMGWRPGEGLGKNKEGTLEPLKLQVKMDKKGLVAPDEISYKTPQSKDIAKNFYEGKHPVSLLNELCLRKRYGPPIFDCCYETGPDHKKNFIFKVTVNGVEYKPTVSSQNKKQAKVEAATLCLRALGLIY